MPKKLVQEKAENDNSARLTNSDSFGKNKI